MRKWLPLIAICLGTFMLLIDVTIVNVALPSMAGSLHTSFASLQWVVDGYALALAAFLLGIGSVADLVGLRKSYIAGLLLFAVASLICGLSPNPGLLVAFRVVQGIGGAAMFATTGALISASYEGRDRGTAFGWWGAVAGAAAAVGPIIGGVLVEAASWRWIFFVNLPISAVAIYMTLQFLHAHEHSHHRKVDLLGTTTFSAFAALLTYALIQANETGWHSTKTWGCAVLSAVFLIAFLVLESRIAQPMLDLSLFKSKTFSGVMFAAIFTNFAAFSALTYSSIWLQTVKGLSPLEAGLTGLPLAATSFAVSASLGRFIHGGTRPVIGVGMLMVGIGSILVSIFVQDGSSWPSLVVGFFVIGIGVGLSMPTLTSTANNAVTPDRFGMATGAVNTARQLGYGIGIATLGSVFAAQAQHALAATHASSASGPAQLARSLAGGQAQGLLAQAGNGRAVLSAQLHHAAIRGIDGAFLVAGIGGVIAGLVALVLIRPSAAVAPMPMAPAAELA